MNFKKFIGKQFTSTKHGSNLIVYTCDEVCLQANHEALIICHNQAFSFKNCRFITNVIEPAEKEKDAPGL